MRDRDLAPVAAVAAIVCCAGSALGAGLVGGAALAAVGQFTALALVGLGLVLLIARRVDLHPRDARTHMGAVSPVDEDPESLR